MLFPMLLLAIAAAIKHTAGLGARFQTASRSYWREKTKFALYEVFKYHGGETS